MRKISRSEFVVYFGIGMLITILIAGGIMMENCDYGICGNFEF